MSPPSRMAIARPMAGSPLTRNMRLRRIGIGAADLRNVAEAEHASADDEVDVRDILLGSKRARHPQRKPLVPGLDRAGGLDDVLRLQRGDQSRAVDAQAGELLHRELDEDLFVLGAQDLDLRDVGHMQQLRADRFDIVAKLAMGESVGREPVDGAEGVAELVVEARPDDAGGQRVTDVADALANVIPDVGESPWRSRCPSD